jgi:hypothetical protein
MLPMRRPLMLLPLLLLGVGTVVAAPQQRERGRHHPPTPPAEGRQEPQARQRGPQAGPRAERPFPDRRPEAARDRGQDALSDSVRRIERNTRSQVIGAERVPYDGRSVNRIKVVDDRGRVRIYVDDPQQAVAADVPTRDDDD